LQRVFGILRVVADGEQSRRRSGDVSDEKGRLGLYKVGDKVVYPHHGAGTVVKKESRTVLGQKREYLTIKILHNDMTVNVPTENADAVGLRKVIDKQMFVKAKKILASELMYAKDMDEDEAADWLDGVLSNGGSKKKTAKVAATA
jgi:RNA polymerase-interacting CarD/CdnL/TRCF family regulator